MLVLLAATKMIAGMSNKVIFRVMKRPMTSAAKAATAAASVGVKTPLQFDEFVTQLHKLCLGGFAIVVVSLSLGRDVG